MKNVSQWVFVKSAAKSFVTTAFLQAAVISAIKYCVTNDGHGLFRQFI